MCKKQGARKTSWPVVQLERMFCAEVWRMWMLNENRAARTEDFIIESGRAKELSTGRASCQYVERNSETGREERKREKEGKQADEFQTRMRE
eukprot:3889237-Pleurochrysis_carterae.AAC.2